MFLYQTERSDHLKSISSLFYHKIPVSTPKTSPVSGFSAPCTSVLLFSKRDCVFSTKRQPILCHFANFGRFSWKSKTFLCLSSLPGSLFREIKMQCAGQQRCCCFRSFALPGRAAKTKASAANLLSFRSSEAIVADAFLFYMIAIGALCSAYRAATAAFRASTRSVFSHFTPRSSRPMWP